MSACSIAGGDESATLGLRIGALFGILATSALGVAVPFVCSVADLPAISYVRAFAGGVVLATGFVHILGDAIETLSDPCLGWPAFPWAMMITTFATLFTFNFEWVIHHAYVRHYGRAHAHSHSHGDAHTDAATQGVASGGEAAPAARCDCHDGATHDQHIGSEHALAAPRADADAPQPSESGTLQLPGNAHAGANGDKRRAAAVRALAHSVQACTLEAGIIFHSVFIGLALGINRASGEVRSLMVALMFHQMNEGIAIGVMHTAARCRPRKYWLLGAAFFLTTPVAIGIGIGVSSQFNPNSSNALATEGVFNAVSAGVLLYNALVDFIVPTFQDNAVFKSVWAKAAGFACLYLGAGVMALIAKWA